MALFPIQVGKSFYYFNFKMAFRFLHRKNRNAAKRFGKKGWSLRRGKRTFPCILLPSYQIAAAPFGENGYFNSSEPKVKSCCLTNEKVMLR